MPKYLVTKKSWLNLADPADKSGSSPRLVKAGSVVNYDGPVGSSLELIDDKAAKQKADDDKIAAASNKSGTPSRSEMDELLARIAELEGKGKPKEPEKHAAPAKPGIRAAVAAAKPAEKPAEKPATE